MNKSTNELAEDALRHLAQMSVSEFLEWVANRITNVYNESPNVDYVLTLKEIAGRVKLYEDSLNED